MKIYFLSTLVILFAACNSNNTIKNAPGDSAKNTSIVDSAKDTDIIIGSERIDGPANIRDTVNGKILFTLNDNVPVTTTDTINGWCQVGLEIDITKKEQDSFKLPKNYKIIVNGKEVGETTDTVVFSGSFVYKNQIKGILTGYTSYSNIKKETIPENALAAIINSLKDSLTRSDFEKYFKNFSFEDFGTMAGGLKGYSIYENWIDDPSPGQRLVLFFEKDKLFAIIHTRKIDSQLLKNRKLDENFYLSVYGNKNAEKIKALGIAFNTFLKGVD